ncbi:MAG: AAA family ATPase [Lachnospira sp.]|nr:AAA family ATPase [Lachnospira sp.]
MRVALYGLPCAGKSYILDRIDFLEVVRGSEMLRKLNPDFQNLKDEEKEDLRKELTKILKKRDNFIVDGHYSFGDKIVFTKEDGELYDTFLYLYISPEIIRKRMKLSDKNKKYLRFNIESWQKKEVEALRKYCHQHDKDFFVLDNPPDNFFENILPLVEFIKAIKNGFSPKNFARRCAKEILEVAKSDTITLMDGDKTVTKKDSSHEIFSYNTRIYDGNFYTGFQSFRQEKEFCKMGLGRGEEGPALEGTDLGGTGLEGETIKTAVLSLPLNKQVTSHITPDTFILTSGHGLVWEALANKLGVKAYYGFKMCAETKFFITKILQEAGKKVIAYGDSLNDYYMLKQADDAFLIAKENGKLSRSLGDKDLGGINIVRA